MSRNLTPALQTAAQQPVLYPVAFFEGEFVSGMLRLWTGTAPLLWNGQTWAAAGWLLGIAAVAETPGLKADGVTVSLSAIPNSLVAQCLTEVQHQYEGSVWLGLLDPAGDNLGSVADFTFRVAESTAVKFSTTYTNGTSCSPQPTYVLYPLLQQLH